MSRERDLVHTARKRAKSMCVEVAARCCEPPRHLLATQTFIEHVHAKAGHMIYAIWPIGVWAHLVFNGEHGNPLQKQLQDAHDSIVFFQWFLAP